MNNKIIKFDRISFLFVGIIIVLGLAISLIVIHYIDSTKMEIKFYGLVVVAISMSLSLIGIGGEILRRRSKESEWKMRRTDFVSILIVLDALILGSAL